MASASMRPIRTWHLNGIPEAAKIANNASSGFVFLPRISRIRAETSRGSLVNSLAFIMLRPVPRESLARPQNRGADVRQTPLEPTRILA